MKNLSIKVTPYEPITSFQLTETNTPVSLNSKVKTSQRFLKHYIASYFNDPNQEENQSGVDNYPSLALTEPNNQSNDISLASKNKFNTSTRKIFIKAKTTLTTPTSLTNPCKLTKLPPLSLTKPFNHNNTPVRNNNKAEIKKVKSMKIGSPHFSDNKHIKGITSTKAFYTPQFKQHKPCDELKVIIEKCDKGIKEVNDLGNAMTTDSLNTSNGVSQTLNTLKRRQRNIRKEEAELFTKVKSHSINELSKVETISANYAFKNRTNFIEEYNYFDDDNDFIFSNCAEGVLKKKEMKKIFILKKKNNDNKRHIKFNNLIQNCIQDKNTVMNKKIVK